VARETLKREDFFLSTNRIVFRRMLEMAEAGQAIDLVAVIDGVETLGSAGASGWRRTHF
jgi:replicative DNA helicase